MFDAHGLQNSTLRTLVLWRLDLDMLLGGHNKSVNLRKSYGLTHGETLRVIDRDDFSRVCIVTVVGMSDVDPSEPFARPDPLIAVELAPARQE